MNSIPRVDLADYLSGDPVRKNNFVNALGKAYEDVGFVAVKNHGLTQETIDLLYNQVEQFFSQPVDLKKKYENPELAGQRGYTSFGREHAKGSDAPDLKEFYQWGQTVADKSIAVEDYPDNIMVEEHPQFNQALQTAYETFEEAGRNLLRAIALFLDLPESYFDEKIKYGNSILRAIHYPPITSEPKNSIRAEQHEDIDLITLLIGASADGLELLNNDNEWVPINAGPGEIVVNVGDMLQRLANNRLKSTTHRVVNPPREKWGTHRYSIPFFLHPKSEMDLTCLESCITEENPKHFPDTTAGEYLDERLREIGLKK